MWLDRSCGLPPAPLAKRGAKRQPRIVDFLQLPSAKKAVTTEVVPCAVPLALADGFSDILEEALAKIIEADTDFGAQEVAMCQQVDAELSDGADFFSVGLGRGGGGE